MNEIKFRFNPKKALTYIYYMVSQSDLDLHTALKACYFADVEHINRYYKPIFGASYKAMRYGPVPLEIYEMMKGDPIWLEEMQIESYPWQIEGFKLKRTTDNAHQLDCLSESNVHCLTKSLALSKSLSFSERTAVTHGYDWQNANLGMMAYEDMIEEFPLKAQIVEELREKARFMRL